MHQPVHSADKIPGDPSHRQSPHANILLTFSGTGAIYSLRLVVGMLTSFICRSGVQDICPSSMQGLKPCGAPQAYPKLALHGKPLRRLASWVPRAWVVRMLLPCYALVLVSLVEGWFLNERMIWRS